MSEVHQAIEDLKVELQKMPASDQRHRLEQLVHRLENESDTQELSSEVSGTLEQFEMDHPELVQVLNRIAVTLSDMGI